MANKVSRSAVVKRGRPTTTTHSRKNQVFTTFVGKLKLRPQAQACLPLGEFSADRPAKGFSIEFDTGSQSEDAIVPQIIMLGTDLHYKLMLDVENYGDKSTDITVWSL